MSSRDRKGILLSIKIAKSSPKISQVVIKSGRKYYSIHMYIYCITYINCKRKIYQTSLKRHLKIFTQPSQPIQFIRLVHYGQAKMAEFPPLEHPNIFHYNSNNDWRQYDKLLLLFLFNFRYPAWLQLIRWSCTSGWGLREVGFGALTCWHFTGRWQDWCYFRSQHSWEHYSSSAARWAPHAWVIVGAPERLLKLGL